MSSQRNADDGAPFAAIGRGDLDGGTQSTGSEESGAWELLTRWLSMDECLHFMGKKTSAELVFDGGKLQLTNNHLGPGTLTKVSLMSLPLVVVDPNYAARHRLFLNFCLCCPSPRCCGRIVSLHCEDMPLPRYFLIGLIKS